VTNREAVEWLEGLTDTKRMVHFTPAIHVAGKLFTLKEDHDGEETRQGCWTCRMALRNDGKLVVIE
jgi:hypothetical protein